MNAQRRTARRGSAGSALFLGAAFAVVLAACTLTQSLDYLQSGGADGGGPDSGDGGITEAAADVADASTATVLASMQTTPGLLAQDATSLFWVAANGVFSVPKSGGSPKKLGAAPEATWLTADADPKGRVFLAVSAGIVSFAKDGSGGGSVFAQEAGAGTIDYVASDPSFLYALRVADPTTIEGAAVLRMGRTGAGAVNLAGASVPEVMTVGSQNVTWLDTSSFYELPKTADAGAAPKRLALKADEVGPASLDGFAVDDAALYWSTSDTAGIAVIVTRTHDSVGAVVTLYRGAQDELFGAIAVDDKSVYVIEEHAGSLVRVAKATGTAVVLLSKLAEPKALVVDATRVYLTVANNAANGVVLAVPK